MQDLELAENLNPVLRVILILLFNVLLNQFMISFYVNIFKSIEDAIIFPKNTTSKSVFMVFRIQVKIYC